MPFAELLNAAARGGLILTATRRLARHLRSEFDLRQTESGRAAWRTPAIASGDDWLRQAADRLGIGWRLLDGPVGRRLWERIIEDSEAGSAQPLLQVGSTARSAEEADLLLTEYRQDPSAHPLTADQVSFLRWRAAFQDICRREGWLTRAEMADHVAEAIAGGSFALPPEVWLAGFDDLSPALQRVLHGFASVGIHARQLPARTGSSGELLRLPCIDLRDEVRRAACWARGLLEAGEGEIGIIVPALETYRGVIERIFREEIDPESALHPAGAEVRFNLSLGTPLGRTGAVAAALEILAAGWEAPLEAAGFLLRTPYLGGSVREACARARLEAELRKQGRPRVDLRTLAGGNSFSAICSCLARSAREKGKRLPGTWAGRFAALLEEVGWPGERPLDSNDYQAIKAWHEKILNRLGSFDPVSGSVSRSEALALLRRLAAETSFQPEGPESPIQVVGLLEAAGLRFRHLWIMGLHDGVLPAPPRPNPFLPVPLQVASGMPHASAEREAVFARRVLDRLFNAAPSIILSHPQKEGDAQLLPSPLIRSVPPGELATPPSSAPAILIRRAAPLPEEVADSVAPPLSGEILTGGTAILRDQALCPFRAFSRHRLAAAALKTPDIGLEPGERGNLLHKMLEFFWHRTRDQAGLLALDEASLDERLAESVTAAVETCYPPGSPSPSPLLLRQEKERLRLLAREWLTEVERNRPPFSVMEKEKEESRSFGGVEITTRVDRIDLLSDGRQLVLDYKTGQVEAADLIGDRLLEPQLPVYAVGRGDTLAGVAFAGVRRGKCAFAGVASEAGLLPRVPALADWKQAKEAGIEGWQPLLRRWQDQLEKLGRAFAAGESTVDPAAPDKKSCGRCDLAPLCRIADAEGMEMSGE